MKELFAALLLPGVLVLDLVVSLDCVLLELVVDGHFIYEVEDNAGLLFVQVGDSFFGFGALVQVAGLFVLLFVFD